MLVDMMVIIYLVVYKFDSILACNNRPFLTDNDDDGIIFILNADNNDDDITFILNDFVPI